MVNDINKHIRGSKVGKQYYHASGSPFNARINNEQYAAVKKDPVNVIAQLVRNQASIFSREIKNWKHARAESEDVYNPRRTLLQELYSDIYLDAFIQGVIRNKRILKVSNKPFKIVDKEGKELEDITKMLQKGWMNEFIKLSMESRFFGHSLIYFWEMKGNEFSKVKLVPRKHVLPEFNKWIINEGDMQEAGFDYTTEPFSRYMVGVGAQDDLGLLNPAAPLYILKKHSWANWDEFEEIFGVPMRIAKIASNDPKVRTEVVRWLEAMGSAPYGAFPIDTEIEVVNGNHTDAYEVFDRKRKAANEELEILLLGSRSLTSEHGNYGKEKVTQEETNEIIIDDQAFMHGVINEQVFPILRANGYPISEGAQFTWDEQEWLEPKERLDIFKGAKDLGYTLDKDQVQKDLGVELTGEAEPEPPTPQPEKPIQKAINSVIELNNQYFGNNV